MANDASALKKAAVLTGLTVLMGGAEASIAEASQLLDLPTSVSQNVSAGSLAGALTGELDFNLFNGPGTLTGVEFNLSSTINQDVTGGSISNFNGASVTLNGHTLGSVGGTSGTFTFDVTDPLAFAPASFYSGSSGTFPVGLQISGFRCVEGTEAGCSVNWTGTLTVTFDTAAATTTPLPASLPLLGTGLAGLGLAAWRGRRKQKSAT